MMRITRRSLLAAPAAAFADTQKLLLPSDQPDEHGFRLMWYNPVPPIDQTQWRLRIGGLGEKAPSPARSRPRFRTSSKACGGSACSAGARALPGAAFASLRFSIQSGRGAPRAPSVSI